jgi:hypothetical protein
MGRLSTNDEASSWDHRTGGIRRSQFGHLIPPGENRESQLRTSPNDASLDRAAVDSLLLSRTRRRQRPSHFRQLEVCEP